MSVETFQRFFQKFPPYRLNPISGICVADTLLKAQAWLKHGGEMSGDGLNFYIRSSCQIPPEVW